MRVPLQAMEKAAFEIPTLRPRIGGRGGEVAYQRAPLFIRSVLIRASRRFARVGGLSGPGARRKLGTRAVSDVPWPTASARRCVVKARVVRMSARGMPAARLHLAYIERDGVERDGSEGRLYGTDEIVDRAALSGAIPGERHQFRFIVSPEDDVDLTAFTRDLMGQVEKDLGMRLRWGAVNHYNTDNPHVHVVVRGVDERGYEVWIDRAYISERMRWRAQHLLTKELGQRLPREIERQLEREVAQERVTSVDRQLAWALGPDQTTDVTWLARVADAPARRRLVGRLQTLEALRLAQRTSPRSWQLATNWQDALRDLGERGDVIKRIHRALGAGGDPARYRILDASVDRTPVEGVVRRKGLHDELRGDAFAIIEDARGAATYVRLDTVNAQALAEGAIARVSVEAQTWAKPMDRVLEQVARENGGVYDPKTHLEALRRRPVSVGGRPVAPEAVVEANLRRLTRLESYNLVARLSGDRWTVPADLVAALRAREVSHPRRMVRARTIAPPLAKQIALRAPSWLDEQEPAASRAPYGLGAEVDAALAARARFLAGLGIAVESRAERLRALTRLEQADIGRALAARHGVVAMASPSTGMRGRLLAGGASSNGAPLAYVLDEQNRRLAVLLLPSGSERWIGRTVTMARDAVGRLRLRHDGLKRGD